MWSSNKLDPAVTTADNLSGQIAAKKGGLPEIRTSIDIDVHLMHSMTNQAGESERIHRLGVMKW